MNRRNFIKINSTLEQSVAVLGILATLGMVGWLITAEAWAHRDRGPDDPCRRQLGAELLHLTLYQPQFDPSAEYCEEVPRAGRTILVVDVTPGKLREVPMGLEVVAASDSGQSRTLLEVPPQIYERGVVDTEVVLNAGNEYLVRVGLELGADTQPQLLSFPIQVAAWYRALIMPALIVAALLILTILSVLRYYVVSRQNEALDEALAEEREAV